MTDRNDSDVKAPADSVHAGQRAMHRPELQRRKLDALIRRLGEKRQPAEGKRAARSGIPRLADPTSAPLSFAQQRLWFLDRLQPGSAAYNVPGNAALRLDIDRRRK